MNKSELPKILILQGPVGYFFDHLHKTLINHHADVWRVTFNFGDRLFSTESKNRVTFNGTLAQWEAWLALFIKEKNITDIVLFGCMRPVHVCARNIANAYNVKVLSLEEGYIRPGFITIEKGGNNACSPYANKLPPEEFVTDIMLSPTNYRNNKKLIFYSTLYYITRALFSSTTQKSLFHKSMALPKELYCWIKNGYRYLYYKNINDKTKYDLIKNQRNNYYLVALQVSNDCQLKHFSNNWNSNALILSTIESFSIYAPSESILLFKIHPLERGHSNQRLLISRLAKQYNISSRVKIIETGTVASIMRCSAGVITVNSTVGLSAIYHGVPLLVLGNAFYSNSELCITAKSKLGIDSFWNQNFIAPNALRKNYINWIKGSCLVSGDFYVRLGVEQAVNHIINKLDKNILNYKVDEAVEILRENHV